MKTTIRIHQKLNGPPGRANGGIVAGAIANHLEWPFETTIRRPVPLGEDLALEVKGDTAVLWHDFSPLAEARRTPGLVIPAPPAVSFEEALAVAPQYRGFAENVVPGCFVCGHKREDHDGLRIFPTKVNDDGVFASTWIPDATLSDGWWRVRPEFIAGALDCPGAFAIIGDDAVRMMVLGRIAVQVNAPVFVGQRYVVAGWKLGDDGRKHDAGTAIYAEDGTVIAAAMARWIDVAAQPIAGEEIVPVQDALQQRAAAA
jgi:hypothetical protein